MDRKVNVNQAFVSAALVSAVLLPSMFACRPDKPPEPHDPIYPAPVLESKLSDEDRETFYHMPMGTGIFEYYAFMALEDPKTNDFFYHNLERFGFLADLEVPAGLPVGMTIEKPGGLPVNAVGVNCSACHVNEYRFNDQSFRVEGAPNLIDLISFKQDLVGAAEHTLKDPALAFRLIYNMVKQHSEAKKLLEHIPDYETMKSHGAFGDGLAEKLNGIVSREQELAKLPKTGVPEEGHLLAAHDSADTISSDHSMDAHATELHTLAVPENSSLAKFSKDDRTQLIKDTLHQWAYSTRLLLAWIKTLILNLGDQGAMTQPGPGRADAWGAVRALLFDARPQTAPSSIPPIWNTADLARYQWNGTTNTNVQRGFSAALGAGAFFDKRSGVSPIRMGNLMRLEDFAKQFVIPAWPEEYFPAIDQNLSERGSRLYTDHCTSCHDAGHRSPSSGLMEYPAFDVAELGTDSTYLTNFKEPVGDLSFAVAMEQVLSRLETEFYREQKIDEPTQLKWEPESRRPGYWESPATYPARSLEGVWTTAPYLHNNSVPTLYDLLLPASERPKKFFVGTREYDPKRIGFRYDAESNPKGFELDTSLKGNSNAGHEYATTISDADRWALVEFLKTK
jgi:hypothetical protein